MPVLQKLPDADVKKFFLPSTAELPQEEQAWVTMDVSKMSMRDLIEMDDFDTNNMKRGFEIISKRLKEWNFTEEDGTPILIDSATLIRLPFEDLSYLLGQIPMPSGTALSLAQKKS